MQTRRGQGEIVCRGQHHRHHVATSQVADLSGGPGTVVVLLVQPRDQLRVSGGATGQLQHRYGPRRDLRQAGRVRIRHLMPRWLLVPGHFKHCQSWHLLGHLTRDGRVVDSAHPPRGHDGDGLGLPGHMGHLDSAMRTQHQHRPRTSPHHPEIRLDPGDTVGQVQHHIRTRPDPMAGEPGGTAAAGTGQLPETQRADGVRDEGGICEVLGSRIQHLGQGPLSPVPRLAILLHQIGRERHHPWFRGP